MFTDLLNLPIDSDRSKLLPKLTSEFLVKFVNTGVEQAEETSAFPPVNRGLTESPLTIEADFTNELS